MKIQREREQNQQIALSDLELAGALSVRPERWADAVEAHGASHVLDLSASPVDPIQPCEEDEQLNWLKSVMHQLEGMPSKVVQAHLIERKSIKDLAEKWKCSRASLRLHLNEGLGLLRQWAQRDGLMPVQTS